ncbi:hypothetical protein Ocin01_08335 [Orchesella cincta]|uniref:Uncharacterized protein n=1 Tax=Orchesella cincta TaxID=48709 RepID=A0A1D2MZB8_ORCCI|nr:hypothetical protein Ocin01_08335 [Orchesella cincta]
MGQEFSKRFKELSKPIVASKPSAVDVNMTKNVFTHEYLSCWEKIIDFTPNPKDVLALSNASPQFSAWVRKHNPSALLPLVLPIIMSSAITFTTKDILTWRLLNSELKQVVDDSLPEILPDAFADFYSFATADQIQRFLDHSESITGNPIIGKYIMFFPVNTEAWIKGLQMLEKYGHFLEKLLITPFLNPMLPLPSALSYCQNLEFLSVGREWNKLPVPEPNHQFLPQRYFPPLPKLTELRMHFDRDEDLHVAGPLVYSFLRVYGAQLKTFKCFQNVIMCGISSEGFTALFPNLQELDIHGLDEKSAEVFQILSEVKWPKLERICFDEHWEINLRRKMGFTKHSVWALDNFRNSLKELTLPELDDKAFYEGPGIYQGTHEHFRHLKTLSVCASNMESHMWKFFASRFNNLQRLTFRKSKITQLILPVGIPKLFELFKMFPKLEEIYWPRLTGDGEEKYLLFKRNGLSVFI